MDAGSDILKEYLVKLGFVIDGPTQGKVQKALQTLESQLDTLAKNKATQVLIKGMAAYAGAIATVVVATGGLVNKVAEADLEYEKLALKMHMTKDAAKQLTIAQNALNASFEEITWNDELRKRFIELRNMAGSNAPPSDAERQWKMVREAGYEFTKLKVIIQSGTQWIAYHLSKIFGGDIKGGRGTMARINAWLQENLPKWTRWIAEAAARIVNVGKAIVSIIMGVYNAFVAVINILPSASRNMILFFGALAVGLKLNPTLVMLSALFLLLEDYWTWMEGKRTGEGSLTVFGEIWESLDEMMGPLTKSLKDLGEAFDKLFSKSFSTVFWNAILGVFRMLAAVIATLVNGLTTIFQLAEYGAKLIQQGEERSKIQKDYGEKHTALEKEYGVPSGKNRAFMTPSAEFLKKELQLLKERDNKLEALKSVASDDLWKKLAAAQETYGTVMANLMFPEDKEKLAKDMENRRKSAVIPDRATPLARVKPYSADNYKYKTYVDPEYLVGASSEFRQKMQKETPSNIVNIYGPIELPGVNNGIDFVKEMQEMTRKGMFAFQ